MSPLTPTQLALLHEAVVDAFSPPELERLTRFKLGTRLDLITRAGSTPTMVHAVLEYAERRGWTEELIRGVYEERNSHPLVLAFCQQHARFVFVAKPSTAALAQSIGAGLETVATRLDSVRQAVGAVISGNAREQLTDLARQFARLRRYKVLHDCLHNLQFKYARLIRVEVKALAAPPFDPDNLLLYCAEMSSELAACRPEVRELPTAEAETMMLNIATRAVSLLHDGASREDPAVAGSGLQLLEGLLRVQPSRINQHLSDSLEVLQLDQLYATFARLRDAVSADAAWTASLSAATAGLGGLGPRLRRVLGNHRDWQVVDNTLTKIDTDLKLGAPAKLCEFEWQQANAILQSLLDEAGPAAWAQELRPLAAALSEAFGTGMAEGVPRAFQRFRPRAMWYFYEADRELKELSGELDVVGVRLDLVLQRMGNEYT